MVECRLIHDVKTESLRLSIRSWHFEKSVDFTNGRDVFRYESFEFCVEFLDEGSVSECETTDL